MSEVREEEDSHCVSSLSSSISGEVDESINQSTVSSCQSKRSINQSTVSSCRSKQSTNQSPARQSLLTSFFGKPTASPSLKDMTNAVLTGSSRNTPASEKSRKRKLLTEDGSSGNGKRMHQHVIDAGQRRIGAVTCPECKFVGDFDDEEDRKLHQKRHALHMNALVEGRSDELNITQKIYTEEQTLPAGKNLQFVLVSLSNSSAPLVKKVQKVLATVQQQTGLISSIPHLSLPSDFALLLVHVVQKRVIGCLAVENVKRGDLNELCPNVSGRSSGMSVDCKSSLVTESESASVSMCKNYCGIYLLWVTPVYRKNGLARRMIDVLRKQYSRICWQYGEALPLSALAFSDPTDLGKGFITNYTSGADYRTYRRADR